MLATGFTSKRLWNNRIKVNMCQTTILQYFVSCMENWNILTLIVQKGMNFICVDFSVT